MRAAYRILLRVPAALLTPLMAVLTAVALAAADLFWLVFGRKRATKDERPARRAVSIVIPNWNGRDLLERYLPSVEAAAATDPDNEVIVVDNGSTDGSADLLRERFPRVRLLALERNLGFGGGSNEGVRAARNPIVVLLNSDMRVEPGFLGPLLEGFSDGKVFAVSCQIFLSDPARRREETGLTHGAWRDGGLRVRHRIDPAIEGLYPCFYGGGGSCAFDRAKFLELGGFDPLLRPFYLEDTDLGYRAWKRGWKVLYQPRSAVYHEHRGTIGRTFSAAAIEAVLKKNYVLFAWKNIHEWRKLLAHLTRAAGDSLVSAVFGDSPERVNAAGLFRAFAQLPEAIGSRWRARALAAISDTEAFRRPLGGYFRDRFEIADGESVPERPRVLFVSPYPICPPVHGGGVFMHATLRQLIRFAEVHLVCLLDLAEQRPAHDELAGECASAEFPVRRLRTPPAPGSPTPYAVREFASEDVEWLIHRQIHQKRIDVVQLEYTAMAQYGCEFARIGTALFEHDVYFQSIARGLTTGDQGRVKAAYEYLRALRWELKAVRRADSVQVCSEANRGYLLGFAPELAGRVECDTRAAIEAGHYRYRLEGREPYTMLFVGSQRHRPNRTALEWFVREVLPRVLEKELRARLIVAGAGITGEAAWDKRIERLGLVEDIREPLERYAVFVCPVRSGSGMRVKLLEAFAAGIPAVSTRIGAEGLTADDGAICSLADDADGFAARILALFADSGKAAEMARRAREELERRWDSPVATERLVASYLRLLGEKRRVSTARTATSA